MKVVLGYIIYHEVSKPEYDSYFEELYQKAVEKKEKLEEQGWDDVRIHTVEVEV